MKISVITAVYNSEATFGEAIASVAAQTYPDVEHLVVEGKSKDGSLTAIERAGHDQMRLISEPDEGIYDALNKGVRNATGDVVGFIHSDDFLAHDDVLARIASAFEDPWLRPYSAIWSMSHNLTRRGLFGTGRPVRFIRGV